MITLRPPRQRPADRADSESRKPVQEQSFTFTAPVAGWITNENMAHQQENSAFVLDNFWPSATFIKPRGGSEKRVTVDAEVTGLFEYSAGNKFFATDATKIYEFTASTAAGTALTASVTGQTSGDYAAIETQNDAGSFLSLVNGVDYLQLYDGSSWQQVTGVSSPHAITGVDTRNLKTGWNYRSRQWFVEDGTMNAWYLGVNSISGAATKFPLAGVFTKGGALHAGTTISGDSGDGLDDRVVFYTDQGEFAIYEGDPASTFSLVGVYDIGEPMSRNPFIRIAGDIAVCTRAGLIPLSAAITKDPAQLKSYAVSRQIAPEWEFWAIVQPSGWFIAKWESRNMAILAPPASDDPFAFVVNLETGAWSRFTGWAVKALGVLGDNLHYAASTEVFKAETGGQDDGVSFLCKACLSFSHLGAPDVFKQAHRVRGTFRGNVTFNPQFSAAVNYTSDFPTAPIATAIASGTGSNWDASTWDVSLWSDYSRSATATISEQVVSGHGQSHAVQLQITSGSAARLDTAFVSATLYYSAGR